LSGIGCTRGFKLSIAAHPGTKGQIVDQGLVETRGGKGLQNFTAPGVLIFGMQCRKQVKAVAIQGIKSYIIKVNGHLSLNSN
jgi:hypothetical protein